MKKALFILVAGLLLLTTASGALAASYNQTPIADSWVDNTATNFGTATTVKVNSSAVGSCNVSWTTYMKWDISTVTQAIGSATIALTPRFSSYSASAANPVTVSIFQAANDTWGEATINGTNAPAPTGNPLTSFSWTAPATVGTPVTFPNTTELTNYLNSVLPSNGGNGLVSVAIQVKSCGTGDARIDFDSKESTTGVKPALNLFKPNAVEVSSVSAQPATWPLYAGLAAVALFVVAGVVISRRRTA